MNCKHCGAKLPQGMLVCPECGTRQRQHTRHVRCSYCHRLAAMDLAVCPHCGRNLEPAGPLWGAWLAGLIVLVLVGKWGLDRLHTSSTWQRVAHMPDSMVSLVDGSDSTSSTAVLPAMAVTSSARPKPSPSWTRLPTRSKTLTATLAISLTVTPAVTVTVATTPQATAAADATQEYTVKDGDTLEGIGKATGIRWEDIAAANQLDANSQLQAGQKLRLPTPTPAPAANAPSPTATPAPPQTYRVQAGDTLLAIGERLGVPWRDIAAANNITEDTVLQVDQELTIPAASK